MNLVELADLLMPRALVEAELGRDEGGVPIGAVVATRVGEVVATARNRTTQDGRHLAHAEMEALTVAGQLADYGEVVVVTTMTPCWMCAGAMRFLGVGAVVAGDCTTWSTDALSWLEQSGVDTLAVDDAACIELFDDWLEGAPPQWAALPSSVEGKQTD